MFGTNTQVMSDYIVRWEICLSEYRKPAHAETMQILQRRAVISRYPFWSLCLAYCFLCPRSPLTPLVTGPPGVIIPADGAGDSRASNRCDGHHSVNFDRFHILRLVVDSAHLLGQVFYGPEDAVEVRKCKSLAGTLSTLWPGPAPWPWDSTSSHW